MSLDINENEVDKINTKGCIVEDDGSQFFDIDPEIKSISLPLSSFQDLHEYEKKRQRQISEARNMKFGKKSFKWILSRLNYYSIGAKFHSYWNKFKFKKCMLREKV